MPDFMEELFILNQVYICDNNKIINSFNMRLIDSHYASSNTAKLGGKFVYFNVHDALHYNASNFIVPYIYIHTINALYLLLNHAV